MKNKILIFLIIFLILKLFNEFRFKNRINTLYKPPSILHFGYWLDYYRNSKKHLINIKKLSKLELNKFTNFNNQNRNKIINSTKYLLENEQILLTIKIHLYEKYNLNLFTMMTPLLVNDLIRHINNTKNIDGAMVDVGCWRGGSSLIMRNYNREKDLFILDSFDSMDDNIVNENDNELDRITIKILNVFSNYFKKPIISTSIDIVKNNFNILNLSLKKVTFIKGNLKNKNFKFDKINKISLLRIDCDFYRPTYNVLENLYPKVEKGGVIILDDFNIPFLEEKQAVMDYFKNNKIERYITNVGQSAYFIK